MRGAGVETSAAPRRRSDSDEVTVERLERGIAIVAEMMVKHDMPHLDHPIPLPGGRARPARRQRDMRFRTT